MFSRILMVCTGNICRSPMAEAVLTDRLAERAIPAVVESAGIAALVGRPADPIAQELMRERGLDLGRHRARQLTPEMIRSFELILVMDLAQQRLLEHEYPFARGRVQRLGRWGRFDVPDPYRRGRERFELALAQIDRGLLDLERALWGEAP